MCIIRSANSKVNVKNVPPGPAILRGKGPIIPFEWYTLEVERRLRDAKMIIDGKEVIKGKSPGSTRGLNIRMDVYFGGFDGERISNARKWWNQPTFGDKSAKD